MNNIKEVLEYNSIEEIEKEIDERRELVNKMVGQLYPSILYDEISMLKLKCWELRKL